MGAGGADADVGALAPAGGGGDFVPAFFQGSAFVDAAGVAVA